MTPVWVALGTFAALLVVMTPIALLAGRGRRRLASLERGRAQPLALAEALDPSVQPLAEATRELELRLRAMVELVQPLRETVPMLRVMDSARSSPRVYPSNWIGELVDAFDVALASAQGAAEAWDAVWSATPERMRARAREVAPGAVAALAEPTAARAFEARRRTSSAFSYIEADELDRLERIARAGVDSAGAFSAALGGLRADPYR